MRSYRAEFSHSLGQSATPRHVRGGGSFFRKQPSGSPSAAEVSTFSRVDLPMAEGPNPKEVWGWSRRGQRPAGTADPDGMIKQNRDPCHQSRAHQAPPLHEETRPGEFAPKLPAFPLANVRRLHLYPAGFGRRSHV